mgnify:CR=1 FL=1
MSRLDELNARGFDQSVQAGRPCCQSWIVRCSQCDAAVINGIPCHETGCPRAPHECHGCSSQIPARARYCPECAS